MKSPRPRICVASWDETLLRTRTMMLGAYFSVQPAGRFSECVQILRSNHYDLLILCHTLSEFQQETLASIARETYPPVEVLVLEDDLPSLQPYADHIFEIVGGPWKLVMKCAQIVGLEITSKVQHRVAAAT